MKKLLLASAAFALLAAPGFAATSGSVAVTGTVNGVCNLAFSSASVPIGTILVNTATGVNTPQTATNPVGTAGVTFCNTNTASLSITVVPLQNSGQAYTGFTNIIPYTITLPNSSFGALDSTSATGGHVYTFPVGTFVNSVASTDVVTVNTEAASYPVLAGAYNGTVTISFTP